ncbi:MAG: type II secretion system F family protein [Candidatus Bipolaricaulia bacterium]
MATTYTYKARTPTGQVKNGRMEGETQRDVAAKLKNMGFIVINIAEKKGSKDIEIPLDKLPFFGRVTAKDMAVFSRQFATMINSGLGMNKSLTVLAEQTANDKLRKALQTVQMRVEEGASLSEAMGEHPNVFSNMFISMVESGETGGVLDEILERLADYLESQEELRGKIKSAMTYPAFMFGLTLLAAFGIIVFILPSFADIFESMEIEGGLPLPTQILIDISNIFRKWVGLFILAGGVLIWGIRSLIKKTERGAYLRDVLILKLPIVGGLFRKTAIARFARTFGTLLRTGVPIIEAINITEDVVGNKIVQMALEDTKFAVQKGRPLAEPLAETGEFPDMVVEMLAVGEETGALDEMLIKIAGFYDREVSQTTETLTSLIEPLMMAMMGLVIGSIIISLYLPIFKLTGGGFGG